MTSTDDYIGLITTEHQDQPKFAASLLAVIEPLVESQNITLNMSEYFDLDLAVGAQLDVIGEWVGQSRVISVPLVGVYFSWGGTLPTVGWGFGVWKGPYDPSEGLTTLDDTSYRFVLRAKIIANSWDGTLTDAKRALDLLAQATDPGTYFWISDFCDLSMAFVISGNLPSIAIQQIFAKGLVPVRPVGVSATAWVTSVDDTPVFAWGMNNAYGAGWGTGAWAYLLT